MFSKGDKVISNKYGIGVVVKPSFLRSTVDFGKEKKTVFNNTLTAYKEENNNNTLEEANTEPKPSLVIEDNLKEVQPAIIEEDTPKEVIKEKKEETLETNNIPPKPETEKKTNGMDFKTKDSKKPFIIDEIKTTTNISREILKAINRNEWLKVKYKNTKGEETSFMIGIKDIIPEREAFVVDSFNIMYKAESEERRILYSGILAIEVIEGTYHKTPDELLKKIATNKEKYSFLDTATAGEDILDYYTECFRLDNVPYKSSYGLVKSIDNDTLMENNYYQLSDEQFKELSLALETKKAKQRNNNRLQDLMLVINKLSIKTKKGLYVLAYRELKLDINKKQLIPGEEIIINSEFAFDSDTNNSKNVMSILKFIPEESLDLLNDFEKNEKEIHKIILEYNNMHDKPYKDILDSSPYIVNLCKNIIVDIDAQFNGIRKMIQNPGSMSLPIRTFLGDSDPKGLRKIQYPIYVVDEKYNIDQINAINIAMKSPVSYIQGPPGTGKTKTLLNMIFTIMYNGKNALVTSNNNIPMDGVYQDIMGLEYKPGVRLLFPVLRLGNQDNIHQALNRIQEMMEEAKGLTVKEELIQTIKQERRMALKGLTDLLSAYEEQLDLLQKKENVSLLIEKTQDEALKINFQAQLDKIQKDLDDLGEIKVDDERLRELMAMNFRGFFMSIHFDTVSRLKRIKREKNKALFDIIKMPTSTKEEIQNRVKEFKKYLSNDKNLMDFLDIFPIIISTNLSCTYLGNASPRFDYVMMDEAGQCNVSNALIPIVRAERLVLVGDPQQLRPVVVLDKNVNKKLMKKFNIPKEYDYIQNSIYTSYTNIDVVNNETLLSYHYRCNNKIIGFSNKKYYNNKLKLKSPSKEGMPLALYDTSKDDLLDRNTDKNISTIEASWIAEYIKKHPTEEVGVITPFVHQKECIEYYFEKNGINNVPVGTVHAFQGDQKSVIIFSTAITKNTHIKTYEWLKNNKELINVAVSRPKDKLVLLGSCDAVNKLSSGEDDLAELFKYVNSNGDYEVTNVSPKSKALGTREISTESEIDFKETLDHLISVLNNNCYVKQEVSPASIFRDEKNLSPWFYNQRFDFVVFEKGFKCDNILAIIELNGPEHSSREDVIQRDNYKKKLCEEHNIKLFSIPRECARDYYIVKDTLKDTLTK